MARSAIRGNADDRGAGGGELGAQPVEVDGLGGAAGGVVLGIEVDYDRLALQVVEMRPAAAVGRQFEIGRHVALNQFLNHIALVSSHYEATARRLGTRPCLWALSCGSAVSSGRANGPNVKSAWRLRINEDWAYVGFATKGDRYWSFDIA